MFKINDNYLKLPGSYLFSTIAKKVNEFTNANPDKKIIRLGIGDVTQPLAPAIIESLHKAVDEMGKAETFHGYAPDLGYEFLRTTIQKNDYEARGCDIQADEIFVSDGAKSLYEQLPLKIEVEDYSTNEKIFYPPNELDVTNTPLASNGENGVLAYYEPWGDVVMFHDSFDLANDLYQLGNAIEGIENIENLSGEITIEKVEN